MLFAKCMIYLLIQLRPVTYRGMCDLTLLDLTGYRQKLLFLSQMPATSREPTPRLLGTSNFSRTVLRKMGDCCSDCREHFLCKLLARIFRIRFVPGRLAEHPDRHDSESKCRSQRHKQQSRWERFPLRNIRSVKDPYYRDLLDFLDLGQLILLG